MYLIYVSDLTTEESAVKDGAFAVVALAVHENDWNNSLFEISRFQQGMLDASDGADILDALASIKEQGMNKANSLLRAAEGSAKLQAELGTLKSWAFLSQIDKDSAASVSTEKLERLCQTVLDHIGAFCWNDKQHGLIFAPQSSFVIMDRILSQRKQINLLYSEYEWGKFLEIPSSAVVENPVCVELADSPFAQLATLNAFMAAQKMATQDVNKNPLWDLLGSARGEFPDGKGSPNEQFRGIRTVE